MMLWKIKKLNKYKNSLFHLDSQPEIAYSLVILGKCIKGLLGANTQINNTFKEFFFWLKRGGQYLLSPVGALDTVFCLFCNAHFKINFQLYNSFIFI